MKQLCTMLLLLVATASFGQIRIEGTVKDSIGNPLELANVVAINQATKGLDDYGITNDKGLFRLNVKPNTTYKLQVTYVGMKPGEAIVETKEVNITKDFTLMPDNLLDEVELVYEMPVSVKGDTLVYNADSFKTGTERKLKDVISKLPGFEINDDGQIEVEGKAVSKIMVEGKDFFDGDTKIASDNIPADALDKIEVLRNYDEVGQLSSLRNNQDNIALNIKLKEGKKKFWFGEVTAGGGPDERYAVHPKLFYYSPKTSVNIITDMNNIGDVPFTRRDYFNFTGGFRGSGANSGTSFNAGSGGGLGFLNLQNNRAKSIESKFAATNISYSPKKTLDFSGFAIYSGNRTDMQQNSSRDYVETQGTPTPPDERTESNTHQKTDLGLFKFSTRYKPNANNHLDYDIFGRVSNQRQFQDFYSSVLGDIDEVEKQKPFSLNQNLNYYYTLNAKNIFAFEVQHLLSEEDPFYNAALAQSDLFAFDEVLGLDQNQSGYNVVQDKLVKTNRFDAKVDYWYVLNDKSNINLTLGGLFSKQDFNSNIFQILDNGNEFELNNAQAEIENDVTYNFTDAYLGVHYRLKTGIFTLTPGFNLHSYTTNNKQFGDEEKLSFGRITPDLNIRMDLKKSESITFNYRMQTSFSDINQFAAALVFNNYNSVFRGNRELESALSHNLTLRYFSFNMFNFTNVNASINYNKRVDQVRSQSEFLTVPGPNPGDPDVTTTNRISTPFNSNFADESVSANGRVQKTFGKIKTTLGGNFSYSKFNQFINNTQTVNESFSQRYNARLGTNFRYAPNVEIGYNLNINEYEQGRGKTKFYTHSPIINVDAYFLKAFTFDARYSYYDYRSEGESLNTYSFMDATLMYKKEDSKWEYIAGVTNLFNTEALNQDSNNGFFTSTSQYFIQPRYFVFKIRYNL